MSTTNYRYLLDPLLDYSYSKTEGIPGLKKDNIRLIYEIILEATCDLYNDDKEQARSAALYFDSDLFLFHCECAHIDPEVMLYIVENQKRHIIRKPELNNESIK